MAEQQPGEDNPSGYCYPAQHDHQHISKPSSNLMTANHQIQASCNFEAPDTADDQVYDLTAGVEMIGFRHHKTTAAAGSATTPTNPPMMYKGFFQHKQPILQLPTTSSSSSQAINQASTTTTSTTDHFYQQGQGLNVRGADDDCSTRALRCVFPCEGNERPSQGLSLSLNSNNPSSIGLQSFELRRPTSATYHPSSRRHHYHQQGGSTSEVTHQDFRLISPPPPWNTGGGGGAAVGAEYDHAGGQPFLALSYSKYFRAAQELLNEFCKLGSNDADAATDDDRQSQRQGHNTKNKPWGHEKFNDHGNNYINASSSGGGGGGSSTREQQLQCALYGLDLLELQKRKRRLLVMLEELERRYRHYSNEMKSIVSSFEAVAGDGSASSYTCLASKAMSRHFRSLKDGIVGHIKAIKKAVGEKDPPSSSAAAPAGTTKGETPRLRILDQTLRQQRAFQQMTMIETHPWRPQRGLPERSVSLLRAWLFEHFLHPYPSDVDKHILARQTGLTRSQVSNWFINARVRLWKPMVEEMYLEETKEEQEKFMASSSSDHHNQLLVTTNNNNNNINNDNDSGGCNNHDILNDHHANYGLRQTTQQQHDDEKPNVDALIRFGRDSECISSIIANNIPADENINKSIKIPPLHASNGLLHQQQQRQEVPFGRVVEAFGPIDIDFASYNDNAQHQGHHQSFGAAPSASNAAGGVSLTLGLQQNGGNNNGGRPVSLAFSDHHAATAAPHDEHSLYYPTGDDDRMEPAAVHEYSLFDGDHGGQNLPYRNLMGAQMLHDFA